MSPAGLRTIRSMAAAQGDDMLYAMCCVALGEYYADVDAPLSYSERRALSRMSREDAADEVERAMERAP